VFDAWHRYKGGGEFTEFNETIVGLMLELLDVLHRGKRSRDLRLRRFCTRLLTQYNGLWTFAVMDGVEPTNNHAERVLRRAALWRKRSFGCVSDAGCRLVERMLTALQSLRLQKRSVLQFLEAALAVHRAGTQRHSLETGWTVSRIRWRIEVRSRRRYLAVSRMLPRHDFDPTAFDKPAHSFSNADSMALPSVIARPFATAFAPSTSPWVTFRPTASDPSCTRGKRRRQNDFCRLPPKSRPPQFTEVPQEVRASARPSPNRHHPIRKLLHYLRHGRDLLESYDVPSAS
jgi:hypothetical protein